MGGRSGSGSRNNTANFEDLTWDVNIRPTGKIKVLSEYNQNAQETLDARIQAAEKAGYEEFKYYQRKTISYGRVVENLVTLDLPVSNNEVNVKKSTNLYKAAEEAKQAYDDVIVLQSKPTSEHTYAHRGATRGYFSTAQKAEFIVMGRKKRGE